MFLGFSGWLFCLLFVWVCEGACLAWVAVVCGLWEYEMKPIELKREIRVTWPFENLNYNFNIKSRNSCRLCEHNVVIRDDTTICTHVHVSSLIISFRCYMCPCLFITPSGWNLFNSMLHPWGFWPNWNN